MSIFITGGTGFLGSYVVNELLSRCDDRFSLLVRAKDRQSAIEKFWKAMQLHMDAPEFYAAMDRIDFVHGDLHAPNLGIADDQRAKLIAETDSVLHIAASLNRKSAKACLNTNLRGTLSVARLAREISDNRGLKRFSHVSTVAVAGQRDTEVVQEDSAIEWDRSDYDPYGRTKKFCEHMICELLPEVPKAFFRPSIVMGDSRFPDTSQFDMVRAFCGLAEMPIVPLKPSVRLDIVPADFIGEAVSRLHLAEKTQHMRYHLSSGVDSPTAADISEAMAKTGRRLRFVPQLEGAFGLAVRGMNRLPRSNPLQAAGALMKVFWPYIIYDTVFDNSRVCNELNIKPAPFVDYCADLYKFASSNNYRYPHRPLPAKQEAA